MRPLPLAAVAVLLAGSGAALVAADRPVRPGRTGHAKPARLADEPNVIGMITYDTGINVGFHPDVPAGSPNLNRIVGNRFNSHLGGPLMMTGRVFTVTIFPAADGKQSLSIIGPPNAMGSAAVLDFLNVDVMANQFNTVQFPSPGVPIGPDFIGVFVGVFNSSQPAGLLGMSDMTIFGQGYHAIQGFYTAPLMATMLEAVPNRNAMFRVRIDVFPVELLDFRLE